MAKVGNKSDLPKMSRAVYLINYNLVYLVLSFINSQKELKPKQFRHPATLLNSFFNNYSVVYKNCAEVYKSGDTISGVYKIDPDGLGEFEVFCDQKTAGGGWTVFQKRFGGAVDFFRAWDDYKRGFGNLNGEFWLGLDKIHRLTAASNKLRVDLEDIHGSTAFSEYSSFSVASERAKYQLSLGSYSGEIEFTVIQF